MQDNITLNNLAFTYTKQTLFYYTLLVFSLYFPLYFPLYFQNTKTKIMKKLDVVLNFFICLKCFLRRPLSNETRYFEIRAAVLEI